MQAVYPIACRLVPSASRLRSRKLQNRRRSSVQAPQIAQARTDKESVEIYPVGATDKETHKSLSVGAMARCANRERFRLLLAGEPKLIQARLPARRRCLG